MGAGIAQLALEHGHEVVLHDVDEAAIARGHDRIADGLARRARKAAAADPGAWVAQRLDGLHDAPSLEDVAQEADWVIEAALEDLDLKQTIFGTLDAAADPRVVLATNTSALSVGAIAARTAHPERVLGLHFFNPAPLMRLVEVVATERTTPALADKAVALVESWGKTAVRAADRPGFIVNRVNRPFTLEALRILESGRASVAEIDGAMTAAGYPMGPFAYLDLVGLDVNLAVATAIHGATGAERLRPSTLQKDLVDAGHLGRKTGRGFYRHDGEAPTPASDSVAAPRDGQRLTAEAIVERLELALANEAFHALFEGVASADDIDRALQLGANHPHGPIARAHARGLRETRRRLLELTATEGDRFQPAPGLGD
jgi:3-hydroxybutyryl-CoA dehydrogenase